VPLGSLSKIAFKPKECQLVRVCCMGERVIGRVGNKHPSQFPYLFSTPAQQARFVFSGQVQISAEPRVRREVSARKIKLILSLDFRFEFRSGSFDGSFDSRLSYYDFAGRGKQTR
jgi:hypothetical protein